MLGRSVAWPLAAAAALALVACTSGEAVVPSPSSAAVTDTASGAEADAVIPRYRIVALGDSYTLGAGTDAPRRDSWPAQMTAALNERGGMRVSLYNLAQEGHPSIQVFDEQLRDLASYEPDIVTLQVGLNDIVSHDDDYSQNVAAILDELLTVLEPERIFAVTTPDHTLTEWGRERGSHEAVEALNASLQAEAEAWHHGHRHRAGERTRVPRSEPAGGGRSTGAVSHSQAVRRLGRAHRAIHLRRAHPQPAVVGLGALAAPVP